MVHFDPTLRTPVCSTETSIGTSDRTNAEHFGDRQLIRAELACLPRGIVPVVDWFLLATAHHQAGEKADARACYEHAAGSISAVADGRQWTQLFREASSLLGIRRFFSRARVSFS
jgi:hypothetical protein